LGLAVDIGPHYRARPTVGGSCWAARPSKILKWFGSGQTQHYWVLLAAGINCGQTKRQVAATRCAGLPPAPTTGQTKRQMAARGLPLVPMPGRPSARWQQPQGAPLAFNPTMPSPNSAVHSENSHSLQ
jgi:hypothetical protein